MSDDNSSKALKAGIWYTFSNFLAKGLVFLTTPIFTRILSKSEYGAYSNFATWQTLILIIATFELYSTIARAKFDFEENLNQYISTIAITGSMFTMFCYVIVICFMPFFSELFDMDTIYIHIMFIYVLTAPALQILLAKHRIFMEYKGATLLTITSSVGSIAAAVGMVMLVENKLFGRIFGQEIVLIVFNTAIYVWIVFQGRSFKLEYCKYALAIALPLVPHLLAGNLLGSFDKIAIQKLCGSEDLAYYSLAFNCSLLAKVLWDSLNQAMVPWLYGNLSKNEKGKIKKVSCFYLLFFLAAAVGIMLFVPEVIIIFGGESYIEAKYVMPPIIMGACFQFVYAMYVNLEMYKKKTISISIGTIAASLLNIPLNYFFIKRFGYIAAAYTTMFCYGLLMLFHYFMVRIMKMNDIYDNKFNFSLLLIMCAITVGVEILYSFEMVRRVFLAIYLCSLILIIYFNISKIRCLLKR